MGMVKIDEQQIADVCVKLRSIVGKTEKAAQNTRKVSLTLETNTQLLNAFNGNVIAEIRDAASCLAKQSRTLKDLSNCINEAKNNVFECDEACSKKCRISNVIHFNVSPVMPFLFADWAICMSWEMVMSGYQAYKVKRLPLWIMGNASDYKNLSDILQDLGTITGVSDLINGLPGSSEIEFLENMETILDFDDRSVDGIAEKTKAWYLLLGGKKLVEEGASVGDAEAGLVIDLVVSEAKNYAENQLENVYLIQQLLQQPELSVRERFGIIQYVVGNSSMNRAVTEGFVDVILEKADSIGSLFERIPGLHDYIQNASNGEFQTVSDVYRGYYDMISDNIKDYGVAETMRIHGEAWKNTFSESVAWWKDLLHVRS